MGDLSRQRSRSRVESAINQVIESKSLSDEQVQNLYQRLFHRALRAPVSSSARELDIFAVEIATDPVQLFTEDVSEPLRLQERYIKNIGEELERRYGGNVDLNGCKFIE